MSTEMMKCVSVLAEALESIGDDEKKLKIQAALRALLTDGPGAVAAPSKVATTVKKRGRDKIRNVKFAGHLRKVVKNKPERIMDLIEPLRELNVLLSSDSDEAFETVQHGFRKSPKVYREYPNDRWGLISYPTKAPPPPQLVMG